MLSGLGGDTMKWFYFVSTCFVVICTQAQQSVAADRISTETIKTSERGSLSPSAPVNLTYHIDENTVAGQPLKIDIAITTRLASGTLLVEVAKQEGASIIGGAMQRIDLASAARPINFQLQAVPSEQAERFLVLLLTVDTDMGQMSRSFRIDLSRAPAD